jgi:ADP-ribosylglycohydrolase
MICIAKTQNPPAWHAGFLAILPRIRRTARIAFCHLRSEAREDAVQEAVANACRAYARLAERSKLDAVHPAALVRYVYHTVPVAVYAWLRHYGDFRATVEAALDCGGDTDTVGATAGTLAGATVGAAGIAATQVRRGH